MRNCVSCNKELSRKTKGDLCLHCYRCRNSISDIDNAANTNLNEEFPVDSFERSSDNTLPLYKDNELDERAVISLLKQNMIQERIRNTEIINILKRQIEFMKNTRLIQAL